MILYEHPDDYLMRLRQEQSRRERRDQLLRALRGSVAPFDEAHHQRLVRALRETAQLSGR